MGNIDELINRLAQDSVSVKLAPHPYKLSLKLMGWAVAYLTLSLMFSGMRPDMMLKLHEPWFVAEIAALACIFVTTSLSTTLLSFPDMYQMSRLAFAPAIAFVLFVFVMFLAWQVENPPAPLPIHSFECTISITLFSILPTSWTFFQIRKFACTHYSSAGSVALFSAFSVGALWLRLYEVNDSITHVIEWHYLPMLVFGIVGLWLGKTLLKW